MRTKTSKGQNFILLPASQMEVSPEANPIVNNFLVELSSHTNTVRPLNMSALVNKPASGKKINMRVIDSIHENGAKLVQMEGISVSNFRFAYPGLRIIPEVFYERAWAPRFSVRKNNAVGNRATTSEGLKVSVVSAKDNSPINGVKVVAFTDFVNRQGTQGKTNRRGIAVFKTKAKTFQRLYAYPEHSFWPYLATNLKTKANSITISLSPIDLAFTDCIRHFYNVRLSKINAPIKVGVIDTGVGPHSDINLAGGANTIAGENPLDFSDNGEGHGTHVAGIIGAYGGINGVAAGVSIMSYRVFPVGEGASNFSIMKAIDQAVADGCDLINMSLGQAGGFDEAVVSSIKDAYSKGTICFVATGNDGRQPVNFPAFYSLAVAVTAMGRKGTYPPKTEPFGSEAKPSGKDPKNYVADFSNIGKEVDLTAPGVGVISTFPNNLYAIMSGTSMACPAATGSAARLLSSQSVILSMQRDQRRSDAMLRYLSSKIELMGFGNVYEGMGRLKP